MKSSTQKSYWLESDFPSYFNVFPRLKFRVSCLYNIEKLEEKKKLRKPKQELFGNTGKMRC